jgi:hypothetical protein
MARSRLLAVALCTASLASPAAAQERFYAYTSVPTLDGKGQRVKDRDGSPGTEGICLVWQRGWETSQDYVQVEVENVTRWYTGFGYHISGAAVTFDGFAAPMVEDHRPGVRRRIGPDEMVPNLSVTVPLSRARPPGCTDRWASMWAEQADALRQTFGSSPVRRRRGVDSDIGINQQRMIDENLRRERENMIKCNNFRC